MSTSSSDHPATTIVYTDGACRGNPGPGGWAWAVPGGRWASGHEAESTNQRMEIKAALDATETFGGPLRIVSDSTYVVNCWRDQWWKGWLARGWKNSQKKDVANRDLWAPLVEMMRTRPDLTFEWVKGHSGDPMNDLVDALAVAASWTQRDDSGDQPPRPDQLGPSDQAGVRSASTSDEPAVPIATSERPAGKGDGRVPDGWLLAVVGLRDPKLVSSPNGAKLRTKLAGILAAHGELHDDLVVLTGLRPGAEQIAADAASEAGVRWAAVLPYPDPMSRSSAAARRSFEAAVAAADDVITLEKKRPADAAGMRSALARRDGWLRANVAAAVVVTDGHDAEAEAVRRSFAKAVGDDLWELDITML